MIRRIDDKPKKGTQHSFFTGDTCHYCHDQWSHRQHGDLVRRVIVDSHSTLAHFRNGPFLLFLPLFICGLLTTKDNIGGRDWPESLSLSLDPSFSTFLSLISLISSLCPRGFSVQALSHARLQLSLVQGHIWVRVSTWDGKLQTIWNPGEITWNCILFCRWSSSYI